MTTTERQRRYGLRRDALILHCPKGLRATTNPFHVEWEAACSAFFSDPSYKGLAPSLDELTVLTYNTRPEVGLLERCLARLGITDLVVLGRGLPGWSWSYKISLVLAYLRSGQCTTPYVLCLDDDDVLVIEDLAVVLDRFLSIGCQMLFSNTHADWPPSPECAAFEASLSDDPDHCHLNAGGYVASTAYLTLRLEEIERGLVAHAPWCMTDRGFDDQLAWRHMHRLHHPDIQIDRECRIFVRFDDRR